MRIVIYSLQRVVQMQCDLPDNTLLPPLPLFWCSLFLLVLVVFFVGVCDVLCVCVCVCVLSIVCVSTYRVYIKQKVF